MRLDILNTILFLGIFQGIFLAITLNRIKTNQKANNLLALLLILSSIMLITRIILIKNQSMVLFQRLSLIEPIIFLYGPLAFRYVRLLLQKEKPKQKEWLVYLLAFAYVSFTIYLNIIPSEKFEYNFNQGQFTISFILIEGVALVLNVYYWAKSIQFLLLYQKQKHQHISFEQKALKLVRISQYIMGVVLFGWIIGFVGTNFLGLNYLLFGYNTIWVALSLLIYVISFFAINQPEIFKIDKRDESGVYVESGISYRRLHDKEIRLLEKKLNEIIHQESVFLENDLTLASLALKLDTTSNNLSWFLNNVYKTNFYNFINELRIKEFIKKVENKEHINRTLLALSMEVGFNSKSTFNKAFKTLRNDTPSNFIKAIKN